MGTEKITRGEHGFDFGRARFGGMYWHRWIDVEMEAEATPPGPGTYGPAADVWYAIPMLTDSLDDERLVGYMLPRLKAEARAKGAQMNRERFGSYRITARLGVVMTNGDEDAPVGETILRDAEGGL